jgi:transglutaminase-like putative cysteine protease
VPDSPHSSPRFLTGAALLFWGLETGALIPSIAMAALIELPCFMVWRLKLAEQDFFRAVDLTSVIFASVAVFCFARYGVRGIYVILAWVPYCLYLPVLAQRYSSRDRTPLGALVYGLRRARIKPPGIDVAPPYTVACLIGAATGNGDGPGYFVGVVMLLSWLIFAAMPARYPRWLPAALLAACVLLSIGAQYGVRQAQRYLESVAMFWFYQFFSFERDPDQQITAIGTIGRLKLSDRIQVRVHNASLPERPLLLQEAAYLDFDHGIWSVPKTPFVTIDADVGGRTWTLQANAERGTSLDISTEHKRELGIVPMPIGVTRVSGVEVVEVQRNAYGTIMLEMPPGQIRYRAEAGSTNAPAPAAATNDLAIPASYRPVIEQLARELALEGRSPRDAIAAINEFFARNFRYALVQRNSYPGRLPLRTFLLEQRAGHCEYFATATVLLLRAAGIPARYAVGYLVQEYSPWEKAWIARARHRHAWALAQIDGRWLVVDTTPPAWFGLEDELASGAQWLTDLVAWLKYRVDRIGRGEEGDKGAMLLWLVPPLAVLLFWRLYRRGPTRSEPARRRAPIEPMYGRDSEFYELLARYRARGLAPESGETLRSWAERVLPRDTPHRTALSLHYRYRFDPDGLRDAERAALRAAVEATSR